VLLTSFDVIVIVIGPLPTLQQVLLNAWHCIEQRFLLTGGAHDSKYFEHMP